MENSDQTNFGFKSVSPEEKTHLVSQVFHRVASRYDMMNDAMSLGIHRIWKDYLVRKMKSQMPQHLLDVAGGTGDIAFRYLKQSPDHQVVVCDINSSMIEVGRDRAINQGLLKNLTWTCGDASALPFEDAHFDLYSIAFGLRNVTARTQALQEAFRVLKPGGRFFCLEFSKMQVPILDKLYQFYNFSVIPRLGSLIAQDRASYQYLVESIAGFPSQDLLKQEIQAAGFGHVEVINLSGGIVALHQGLKQG
ncbi:MAG: bifunctional demethylmenaquinone methyltransferase/2-methoxy-6-polyprenyl-1,4-benzoquinol methylase UbiE [Janthinobacterium lividum]